MKKTPLPFLTLCALLVGCSPDSSVSNADPSKAGPEKQAAAAGTAEKKPKRDPSAPADIPSVLTSSLNEANRPSTPDAFREAFFERFEQNLYTPFIDLAFWGEASDEVKKEFMQRYKTMFTRENLKQRAMPKSIEDIRLVSIAEADGDYYFPKLGERERVLVPTPTHLLKIKAEFSPDFTTEVPIAVGVENGRYYFSTVQGGQKP